MLTSRSLNDLTPFTRAKVEDFKKKCAAEGIDLLVTCTYRDGQAQDALYAQGRTAPGSIVTNARAGESWHQYRVALDVVPLRGGKPVWNTSGEDGRLWKRVGEIGESCGLEWAGRWTTFREFPHFQNCQGKTLAEAKAGARLA